MTWTDPDALRDQTAARAGDADLARADRAIRTTVAALAASLERGDAGALADELPGAYADAARSGGGRPPGTGTPFADLLADLAGHEGVPSGVALEYAHVVCQLLAERLSPDTAALLHRHLPDPWRELFHARGHDASAPTPPHRAPAAGAGHTLASGRPGSQHPLSETAPNGASPPTPGRRTDDGDS